MAKRFYRATVILEFDSEHDAAEWIRGITKNPPKVSTVQATSLKLLFKQCRICGIEYKFNTLGRGIIGEPADECREAHAAACQQRMEKNAKSAS